MTESDDDIEDLTPRDRDVVDDLESPSGESEASAFSLVERRNRRGTTGTRAGDRTPTLVLGANVGSVPGQGGPGGGPNLLQTNLQSLLSEVEFVNVKREELRAPIEVVDLTALD